MITRNALLARKLIFTVGAGFALALALIVSLTVLGVSQLAETNADLESIVHENSVKSRLASQMRDILRDRAISMLSIVVTNDPFDRDEEMLRFYQHGSAYQTVRLQLEPLLNQLREKTVLARIDRLTRANQPVMVRTVNLGVEGYTFLAFDLLQKEGIPLQRELVKELDELIRIQREMTAQAADKAHNNYQRTRWLLILLGLLAALVAAIVAWAVIQRSARLAAITERERTKFQTLFETNSDGIVILDQNGFTDCNQATLEMFRLDRVDDFLSRRPEDLGSTQQPGGASSFVLAQRQIQEAVAKGHTVFDWTARRPDGSTFPAEIALHAMTLDGRPVIQAIMRDISAQKEAEAALEAARDAALEATKMKSQFVANVSHEIRTPMNGVLGMTKLLLASPLNPRQMEYAEAISRSAESLMRIINDLLDFSKIEAGRLSLEVIDFDLHALLKDVLALYRPRADAKGIALRLEIVGEPPDWVRGDSLRLRQILLNLLDNAIKFTAEGEVLLRAEAGDENAIRFAVRDSGIGIPSAVQEHIFQAFAQADGSVSRKFGGTGLGLAICRQLTALMGGELKLQSAPNQGSTFYFSLRLAPGQQPNRRLSDHPENLPPQFPGMRILVAEDNPVNQKLAGFMLEDYGVEVLLADDGKAAYELLENEAVDLVLMDCQMPEWDGLTASRAIRAREVEQQRRRLPILALSANATAGFEATCREAGMDDYLCKPLNEATLTAALRRWLPGSAPQAPRREELPPTADPSPTSFNLEKIHRLCRGDARKVAEMLTLFLDSSEGLLSELAQALAARDLPRVARQAHQLKGASAYVGADEATELASAVETAARADDIDACRTCQEDLEAAYIRLFLRIREALETTQSPIGGE
ncbi:MAG: ATP-binding protein [Pseudomonadota bacterium]|nr:ATP-binding protein [Pseudomonadota bacterium]MDP1905482.1 ATP-binding protein [Pseudomonadota bacterium]MDP2353682.1 ATP-binding protein [Pseudomonadota bacterium]